MPYQRHDWESGEVITAEKMDNIENGVVEGFELIAPYENGDTFIKAYNAGDYFTRAGILYKVNDSIAINASVASNISKATAVGSNNSGNVSDELKRIEGVIAELYEIVSAIKTD